MYKYLHGYIKDLNWIFSGKYPGIIDLVPNILEEMYFDTIF